MHTTQSIEFDKALIKKYSGNGPRYTSYPPATEFHPEFNAESHRAVAMGSNEDLIPKPLSLYLHIPFCNTVCYYCGCNKIITANVAKAEPYLQALHREIELQAALFDKDREVTQVHFGGGTPTYISHKQMTDLFNVMRQHFNLSQSSEREFSIEIDPRTADRARIRALSELGFNRLSLGVQDLDPTVQKAVNRVQSAEETQQCIEAAREFGFKSVSIDLIYGLPNQTLMSFRRTLDQIIKMRPQRIALYHYAHLPHVFKVQRQIDEGALPGSDLKLDILSNAIKLLGDAGYVYIGMDHFALADDELAIAQRNHSLQRNFQGYSTHAECDLIGLGLSSISNIGDAYAQNTKDLADYLEKIAAGTFPIVRGFQLNSEDLLRREIISELMCYSELDKHAIQSKYHIVFSNFFESEIEQLAKMRVDGLIEMDDRFIHVTPKGRMMLRNIAMTFDAYFYKPQSGKRFSRVI